MNKTISIILCTYNEVNYIEEAINLITKTLKNTEIIIVDDNSTDGTLNKLDKLRTNFHFKLFVRKKERGFASAVCKGLNEATGDYVGFIDVNSFDQILHFKDMISKLDNRYDISVLSRYIPGGGDERVLLRSFSSKAINLVCKFLLISTVKIWLSL